MSFNETKAGFDHMKDDVTYGDVREIANEAIKAADGDPNGENLLLNILSGHGPQVVFMIRKLAETVNSLVDQLEAEREVAA
jgi:hypothetical protein